MLLVIRCLGPHRRLPGPAPSTTLCAAVEWLPLVVDDKLPPLAVSELLYRGFWGGREFLRIVK